jgi:hypothetical protein
MKLTQIQFVLKELSEKGEIGRNFCLKNYLSRLGAIIAILKKQGLEFKTEWRKTFKGWEGRDYFYYCNKKEANKIYKNSLL